MTGLIVSILAVTPIPGKITVLDTGEVSYQNDLSKDNKTHLEKGIVVNNFERFSTVMADNLLDEGISRPISAIRINGLFYSAAAFHPV